MPDSPGHNFVGPTPGTKELWQFIQQLNDRLSLMEHRHSYVSSAFPQNDLGKPDYDGHRKSHLDLVEQSKVLDGYKNEATRKVIAVIFGVVGASVVAALVDYFRK